MGRRVFLARLNAAAIALVLGVGCAPPAGVATPEAASSPTSAPTAIPTATSPRLVPSPIPSATRRPAAAIALPGATSTVPAPRPDLSSPATPTASPSAIPLGATATPNLLLEAPTPLPLSGSSSEISRIRTSEKAVALTFDAGADRGKAASLLAYLRQAGVRTTFGMTGRWAESNPDLVRLLVGDGHELMNHTYDHRSWTGLSARPAVLTWEERLDEVARTDAIFESLTGKTGAPLFRPPYGDQNPSVLRDVARAGYRYVILWSVDTLGWRGASIPQIVDRCLVGTTPGAIFVLHVGGISKDIDAIPQIVEGVRARGYRFATLRELLL